MKNGKKVDRSSCFLPLVAVAGTHLGALTFSWLCNCVDELCMSIGEWMSVCVRERDRAQATAIDTANDVEAATVATCV